MLIFSLALVVIEFIGNFVIVHLIQVAKHIWDPCCHLLAETAVYFPLICLSFKYLLMPVLAEFKDQRSYSQHFIFFVTYESAQ